MTQFDQRGQHVAGNQYNVGQDATIYQDKTYPPFPQRGEKPSSLQPQQPLFLPEKRQRKAYTLFFCYAHEDRQLLDSLKKHLHPLQEQHLLTLWHDQDINPGTDWEEAISAHLHTADLILLLVSPDFMASDYCYGLEMKQALMRHERVESVVVPIILRPVLWQNTPIGKLQVLPTNAEPVTNSASHTIDEAFLDITQGICRVLARLENR